MPAGLGAHLRHHSFHLAGLDVGLLADHAQAAFEGGRELGLQDDATGQQTHGHPLMLELALRNLVDNALRHTPRGTQVLVRTWRSANAYGIGVLDDGGGPTNASTPAQPGHNLGIGLTLVRRIATEHGAELQPAPPTAEWSHGWRITWPTQAANG